MAFKTPKNNFDIGIAILATMLDQAVISKTKFDLVLRFSFSKVVLGAWLVWLLLMLQVGMLYKGKLFSFLTKLMARYNRSVSRLTLHIYNSKEIFHN